MRNNILELHQGLKNKIYKHSDYVSFYVNDPKLRKIHKACVKDRVLHHAIFRILYPIFDKSFIFDSYSCRNNKGTHRAVRRLQDFARKASRNNTKTCFVLKCDVKKFFASIDQDILIGLIKSRINDGDAIWLIERIIKSFEKGLPLGNITSQLLANVYLNELDYFIKQKLKVKYYIRYCDDFVILADSKECLKNMIALIGDFLQEKLKLSLHPDKVTIGRYSAGVDFLGYISFPHFKILRTKTKNRIIKRLKTKENSHQTIRSYLGVLKHCNSYKIKKAEFNKFLGMIYFIYGEDSYRAKRKLEEIISGYKDVHKSGLNLIYVDSKEESFKDFYSNFKINSMFAEKKLIVIRNIFDNDKFQEEFLENVKNLEDVKDIIIVYEDDAPDKRTKFFKALQRYAKCQEFECLQPAVMKKWVAKEFSNAGVKINPDALDLLVNFVSNDSWRMKNEINKLANYRSKSAVRKEDIEALVKPNIENDIFKTIDALAAKDKKLALNLLHKHLDDGEAPLRLLAMISYQFRNLLTIKELQDAGQPYPAVIKKSGLHPFVAQKVYYMCNQFTMPQLKKIYRKIFQIDLDIKTGKVEPELVLDLFISCL